MNKKHILLVMLAMAFASAHAQSTSQNYVKTTTMLDVNGTNSVKAVQYYNGLGYPTVSVATSGTSGQTAYSLVTYDALGREDCKYLPVSTDKSIAYKAPTTIISNSKSSSGYNDESAYTKTTYDALDRPISVTTAGSTFASKPTKIAYSTNAANEVILYGVDNNSLTQNSYYAAKSLTKETTTDPDGKKVETYKDLSGKLIMQRVGGSLCTYYVYDYLDQLRFVLPPKCKSASDVSALGYEYRYDSRGRIVYKKLPGCGYIKYWYDKADRMICMQDAVMRSAGKYRFSIYDKLNRLVVQGLCTACQNSTTVQNATFSTISAGVLGTGYVMPSDFNNALKGAELEIANYYDNNQNNINNANKYYKYFSDIKISPSFSQKGQLTGSVVAASNGEFVAQLMVYDLKGNLTNSRTKEIGGRSTSNATEYTFTNNVSFSETYIAANPGLLKVTANIGYNTYNNKKSNYALTLNYGTSASASISYAYDKLGRLSTVTRPLPSSVNRNIKYAYDMHGWLTGITTNSFTEELLYASGPGKALYNGNISSIRWTDKSGTQKRGYKFTYDAYNRMTVGTYGEGDDIATNVNRFNEKMTYDENGNILSVVRYGRTGSGSTSYGVMDNLTISYSGNQPTSVSEAAADYNPTGSFEYKKAKGSGYKFNTNGSLIADKSRGIAYITYDYNNNPKQIYFTNGNVTKYVYSASGQKLRAVHYTAVSNITRTWGTKPAELTKAQILYADSTDYLLGGSLTMKNGKLDMYLFDGGYAKATSTGTSTAKFDYYYYNQDHLGNNREVVDAKGNVVQVTNYYPFGTTYADASAVKGDTIQQYKYNGKELDRMHGLNTYDYGARQHDPILGRWDRIDPLCEKYYNVSPYNYCMNNPVMCIDPDGRDWYSISNKGKIEYKWTDYSSQKEMDKHKIKGTYLGKAVVVFEGSRNEKLGKGNNLFGEGAVLAKATVYGPQSKDDIETYDAFTMTSDFKSYGAIADGSYDVVYDEKGKSGSLSSHWAVNGRGPVDCLDGKNPNPGGYSKTQKSGVFIHSSNKNGGMLPKNKKTGKVSPVSTGCPIIAPSHNGKKGWTEFNQQLSSVKRFKMIMKRD